MILVRAGNTLDLLLNVFLLEIDRERGREREREREGERENEREGEREREREGGFNSYLVYIMG